MTSFIWGEPRYTLLWQGQTEYQVFDRSFGLEFVGLLGVPSYSRVMPFSSASYAAVISGQTEYVGYDRALDEYVTNSLGITMESSPIRGTPAYLRGGQ
jgi:hypothetical protein